MPTTSSRSRRASAGTKGTLACPRTHTPYTDIVYPRSIRTHVAALLPCATAAAAAAVAATAMWPPPPRLPLLTALQRLALAQIASAPSNSDALCGRVYTWVRPARRLPVCLCVSFTVVVRSPRSVYADATRVSRRASCQHRVKQGSDRCPVCFGHTKTRCSIVGCSRLHKRLTNDLTGNHDRLTRSLGTAPYIQAGNEYHTPRTLAGHTTAS